MGMVEVKVGDLVRVAPSREGIYLVTSMEATEQKFESNVNTTIRQLPDCVMLASQSESGPPMAMNKKWIEVISESR
jgi:hypothetical protein